MLCALIMAGGKGTRFWPKSTDQKPKQFINLVGEHTMIQLTVMRILPVIPIQNIFVCTSQDYSRIVQEQLPDLPKQNIILEPAMRNTAPCILLSTLYIKNLHPDATIVVLPSDHLIQYEERLQKIILDAYQYIEKNHQGIITIGVVPNRPETGYGYIQIDKKVDEQLDSIVPVLQFVEKPSLEKAIDYILSSKYLWNAGIFIFQSEYLIQEFEKQLPQIYNELKNLPKESDKVLPFLEEHYPLCEKISFDYGIMEHSRPIYVIPADLGWDDIGTWNSIERYIDSSSHNNIIKGDVFIDNGKNNIIYGGNKKIILSNVDDIFCIDSDDVLIIGRREKINEVHKYRENVK